MGAGALRCPAGDRPRAVGLIAYGCVRAWTLQIGSDVLVVVLVPSVSARRVASGESVLDTLLGGNLLAFR
jgi:hypothetical protein